MVFLILYNTKCNTNDSNMMRTFKKGKKIKLPTGFEPVGLRLTKATLYLLSHGSLSYDLKIITYSNEFYNNIF